MFRRQHPAPRRPVRCRQTVQLQYRQSTHHLGRQQSGFGDQIRPPTRIPWPAGSRTPASCPDPDRPSDDRDLRPVPDPPGQAPRRVDCDPRLPTRRRRRSPTARTDPPAAGGSRPTSPTSPARAPPSPAGPTAPPPRPCSASRTDDPPRPPPSPAPNAAISLFRTRNRCRAGVVPGGYSLTTEPDSAIASSNARFASGYARSIPQASTATVAGPAIRPASPPTWRDQRTPDAPPYQSRRPHPRSPSTPEIANSCDISPATRCP